MATVSIRGRVVKIYCTQTGERILDLKRGNTEALITHMSFSPSFKTVAFLSHNNTTHIFNIGEVYSIMKAKIESNPTLLLLEEEEINEMNNEQNEKKTPEEKDLQLQKYYNKENLLLLIK